MSRQSFSAPIVCRCMVGFFGTFIVTKSNPWKLPLIRITFLDVHGSYPEIATPIYSIKLHVLTVFLIDLLDGLTVSQLICQSKSALLRSIFSWFLTCTITPIGHNQYVGQKYQKTYFQEDVVCADFVRFLRLKSTASDMDVEPMIYTICCD